MISNSCKIQENLQLLQRLQQLRQSVYAQGQEIFNQRHNTIARRSFLINSLNLAYKLDKKINLPDTPITLKALTEKDCRVAVIATHADIVGYSFVSIK